MASLLRHPASFHDPSGFVFCREGVIYRQVNQTLAQFRISNISKTGSQSAGWGPEYMRILDDLFTSPDQPVDIQGLKSKAYACAYFKGGCGFLSAYDISTARTWLWRAARLNPRCLISFEWWQAALKAGMEQRFYSKGRALKKILKKRS
jgi:hypothetical protein